MKLLKSGMLFVGFMTFIILFDERDPKLLKYHYIYVPYAFQIMNVPRISIIS